MLFTLNKLQIIVYFTLLTQYMLIETPNKLQLMINCSLLGQNKLI
jgi:hypothetical protein